MAGVGMLGRVGRARRVSRSRAAPGQVPAAGRAGSSRERVWVRIRAAPPVRPGAAGRGARRAQDRSPSALVGSGSRGPSTSMPYLPHRDQSPPGGAGLPLLQLLASTPGGGASPPTDWQQKHPVSGLIPAFIAIVTTKRALMRRGLRQPLPPGGGGTLIPPRARGPLPGPGKLRHGAVPWRGRTTLIRTGAGSWPLPGPGKLRHGSVPWRGGGNPDPHWGRGPLPGPGKLRHRVVPREDPDPRRG